MPKLIDDSLTGEVIAFAAELGSSLTGIADAGSLNEALESDFRPEDVLPGCRAVVVMSLHIPDGALEIMRRGKTNFSYNLFGYAYLNRELDFLAYRMSNFLEEKGYATVPVPARSCAIGARKPNYGLISFRHAAVAAGLASFGLNGIALSRKYGVRQRFIALPTTAPLRPAESTPEQADVCDGCLECLRHCPAGALTLNPPHKCVMGGRTYQYAAVDPDRCREMSAGLSTKVWEGAAFNPMVDVPRIENPTPEEKYDQAWNQRDARIRLLEHSEAAFGATLCGRCLAFCTSGHAAMKRRLRPEEQNNGYADDLVIHKDGALRPLNPAARKLGLELLGKA